MTSFHKLSTFTVALCLLAGVFVAYVGTRREPPLPLDKVALDGEVAAMTRMRQLYRQVKGDYDRLTSDQRREVASFYGGSEARSKEVWNSLIAYDGRTKKQAKPTPSAKTLPSHK